MVIRVGTCRTLGRQEADPRAQETGVGRISWWECVAAGWKQGQVQQGWDAGGGGAHGTWLSLISRASDFARLFVQPRGMDGEAGLCFQELSPG